MGPEAATHSGGLAEAVRDAIESGEGGVLRLGGREFEVSAEQIERLTGGVAPEAELPEFITTGQAADLLGVTRPTVVAMIDRGELTANWAGRHRRLRSADVVAYRDGLGVRAGAGLDELVAVSDELGLYD